MRSIECTRSVVKPRPKVACVASVFVGFPRKFRCFGRAKIGATPFFFALALFSRSRKKSSLLARWKRLLCRLDPRLQCWPITCNRRLKQYEPIIAQSNCKRPASSSKKRLRASHNWFYFRLTENVVSQLLANH